MPGYPGKRFLCFILPDGPKLVPRAYAPRLCCKIRFSPISTRSGLAKMGSLSLFFKKGSITAAKYCLEPGIFSAVAGNYAVHFTSHAVNSTALHAGFGAVPDKGWIFYWMYPWKPCCKSVHGFEAHVQPGSNAASVITPRSVYKLVRYAGAGIQCKAVRVGKERPCAAGRCNAVNSPVWQA